MNTLGLPLCPICFQPRKVSYFASSGNHRYHKTCGKENCVRKSISINQYHNPNRIKRYCDINKYAKTEGKRLLNDASRILTILERIVKNDAERALLTEGK